MSNDEYLDFVYEVDNFVRKKDKEFLKKKVKKMQLKSFTFLGEVFSRVSRFRRCAYKKHPENIDEKKTKTV